MRVRKPADVEVAPEIPWEPRQGAKMWQHDVPECVCKPFGVSEMRGMGFHIQCFNISRVFLPAGFLWMDLLGSPQLFCDVIAIAVFSQVP